jgi:hypothetical protein
LRLKWPLTDALPQLEESEALGFGANWRRSSIPLRVTDGGFEGIVPAIDSARFFRLRRHPDACAEPGVFAVGPRPNPWVFGGYEFTAYTAPGGALRAQNQIRFEGAAAGLDVNTLTSVLLPDVAGEIDVEFTSQAGLVDFIAYDAVGAVVASQRVLGSSPARRSVTLRSATPQIRSFDVLAPNARTVVHKVCGRNSDLLDGPGVADDCREFRLDTVGPVANPLITSAFKVWSTLAPSAGGVPDPNTRIATEAGLTGYHVQYRSDIEFARDAASVKVDFVQFAGLVEFQAFDAGGALVDSRTFVGIPGTPQTVVLEGSGAGVRRLVVVAPNDRTYLLRLCAEGVAGVAGTGGSCLDLRTPLGPQPNPYFLGGVRLLRRQPDGTASAANVVEPRAGEHGVEIGGGETDVLLPAACAQVTLKVALDGGHLDVEAQDAGFRTLDRAFWSGPGPSIVTITLSGPGITRFILKSNDAKGVLAEICCHD